MKPVLWVIVTGLVVRIAVTFLSPPSGGLKRLEPSVIAANLNAGRGLTFEQYGIVYHAWKEPLYIVLLAWLTHGVGQHDVVVLLVQSLFGIGAAVGVAWIARDILGDPTRAMLAGMFAAANPFLVYYDTQVIHPLSLDACLFVAMIGTILIALRGDTGGVWGGRRALSAGFVMGVALWQKAALLAAGAAAWAAAILFGRHRRHHLAHGATWLCVAMIVIAPWLIRNYRLVGRVVVTTDFAHIVWLGNNPWSNGTYSDRQGTRVFYVADPAFQRQIQGTSEMGQYDLFLGEVRRFVWEHPDRFGALLLQRLQAFFWFSPNAGVEYVGWQRVLYHAMYVLLLSLGGIGFVLFWRRVTQEARDKAIVLLASVMGLAAIHALTAINLKHRVPLELVLAIFAAEALAAMTTGLRPRRTG